MGKLLIHMISLVLLVILSSVVLSISSEDVDFGPKLFIYNEDKKEIDPSQGLLNDKKLIFKIVLTNQDNFWVCWDSLHYSLKITREGDEKNYGLTQTISGRNCIAPQDEINFWWPFETYNELKEDKRIGKWRIESSADLSDNINCFLKSDINSDVCHGGPGPTFTGNIKEIVVSKEEPVTKKGILPIGLSKATKSTMKWIFMAAGGVLLVSIIGVFTGMNTSKRRTRILKWLFLFFIFDVLIVFVSFLFSW